MRFVADSMLGKLAKWLRLLGYDTHYQSYYGPGVIDELMSHGRNLLSRHQDTIDRYPNAILLRSNNVGDQLAELREGLHLAPDRAQCFTRCLICNVSLERAQADLARENVPDYIYYRDMQQIHFCPACRRYYWPGSHRTRMLRQLELWGILEDS